MTPDRSSHHGQLYAEPFLYDLAFSYRDYAAECAFLADLYRRGCGRPLQSVLEIAAGPAAHAIEFAGLGVRAAALDLSPEMVEYGLRRSRERGAPIDYWCADMTDFKTEQRFTLVASMLDSGSYLHSDDAFDRHLSCVAEVLEQGGLYVLELAHPSVLSGGEPTRSSWEIRTDQGVLRTRWDVDLSLAGTEPPCLLGFRATLQFRAHDGREQRVESTGLQRAFHHEELAALIERHGRFRLIETLGGFDSAVSFASPKAWRMMPVLQKAR